MPTCSDYTIVKLRNLAKKNKKNVSGLKKSEMCQTLKIPKDKICKDYKITQLKTMAKKKRKTGYKSMKKNELCTMLNIDINRVLMKHKRGKGLSRVRNTERKPCPKGQARNPITARCISERGKLYSELVEKGIIHRVGASIGIHKHGVEINLKQRPKNLKRDLTDLIQNELECGNLRYYKKQKRLGRGAYGAVYVHCTVLVQGEEYCELAIKIEKCDLDNTSTFNELSKAVLNQNKLADVGMAPRVYAIKKCDNNDCITVMDKMKGVTLFHLLESGRATDRDVEDAINAINKMHALGARHGDLNLNNIMKVGGKIMIFDFSYTSRKPSRTPADDWATIVYYTVDHGWTRSRKYLRLYKEAMSNICKSPQKRYKRLCEDYEKLGGEPTLKTIKDIHATHKDGALLDCFGMDL